MPLNKSYARFLNLMRAFTQDNPDPEVEGCEEILAFVAEECWSGKAVRMTDLTRSMELGTAPTVHKKVAALAKKGFLTFHEHSSDKRSRVMSITPVGEAFLEDRARLFKIVIRAAFD